MRVLVTGDRSMPLPVAVPVAAITLLKLVGQSTAASFVLGNLPGVEQAARLVAGAAEVDEELVKLFEYTRTPEGYIDFVDTYGSLRESVDKVVVVHGDLHSSRIFRALLEVFGEDKIEVVSPELVFV